MDPLSEAVSAVLELHPSGDRAASPCSPRSVAASAASNPKALALAADKLLERLGKSQTDVLDAREVASYAAKTCARLGLGMRSEDDLYLAVTAHDYSGSNRLGSRAVAAFLGDFFAECSIPPGRLQRRRRRATAPAAPIGWQPSAPLAAVAVSPPSPADGLELTLRTMSGETASVVLAKGASLEELKAVVARSPLGLLLEGNFLLASHGHVLRAGASVDALESGDMVDVVRATPPPRRVRVECEGHGCGPSIRGSCGTFCLTSPPRQKNGRPIYVRDRELSQWNMAMAYHGSGRRYLLYEDNVHWGGRWALTDDQDWTGYDDRSFAFIVSDDPHPGYLEGRRWHIFRHVGMFGKKGSWAEHDSLTLSVPQDQGLEGTFDEKNEEVQDLDQEELEVDL